MFISEEYLDEMSDKNKKRLKTAGYIGAAAGGFILGRKLVGPKIRKLKDQLKNHPGQIFHKNKLT